MARTPHPQTQAAKRRTLIVKYSAWSRIAGDGLKWVPPERKPEKASHQMLDCCYARPDPQTAKALSWIAISFE
jgi:hypothetical protein